MSKWLQIRAAANESAPVEVLIYGQIGDDWFGNSGVDAKEFAAEMQKIPRDKEIKVHIHSGGGNVWDGFAIANMLKQRRDKVSVKVDGLAASIATIIALSGKSIEIPRDALFMIHDPSGVAMGTADDMRALAANLEKHADMMADAYAEKTGKTREAMRAMMDAETWMDGREAVAAGFCDSCTDDVAIAANFDLKHFRRVPVSAKTQSTPTPHMTNTPVPAEPITPPVTPSPQAAAPAAPAVTAAQFAALQAQLDAERTKRITNEVHTLAAQNTAIDAAAWLPRVLADESLMATLKTIPQQDMGNQPIRAVGVQNLGNPAIEAYRNLGPSAAHMLKTGEMPRLTAAQARARIAHRRDHGAHIEAQFQKFAPQAANTFSATLKPDALIDGLIVVANNRLAPLRAFSTQFSADPVRPMAVVQVKKATAGSSGQTNPVDLELGNSTLAPISVTMAHKTQSFHVDIPDRNWSASLEDLAQINAQAFSNLLSDVYTAVMTVANYGAATAVGVAATFQYDSLKPVLAAAKNYRAKNLLLDGGHRAYLAPTDKFGFEFANTGVPAFGFDLLAEQNRWTSAATNAVGFVCSPDALAVATGLPVTPATGQYDMSGSFALADLGISVGYKAWFNTATGIQWAMYEIMIGAGAGDTTQAEVLVTS